MQFSMKNISIRTQVLVPVVFTIVALLIALGMTQNSLRKEQALIEDHMQSLMFYKDSLANIDDSVYPLRISAVYAIYDAERRKTFLAELTQGLQKVESILDTIEARGTFRSEAVKVREKIEQYVAVSKQATEFFAQRDKGLVTSQEYNDFISNYRVVGNELASAINDLSGRVNKINNQVMVESAQDLERVQSIAIWSVLAVLALSVFVAWILSGMIVAPIQKLQLVMHRVSEGDLRVRCESDGNNEIAKLSKDVNQTVEQLASTTDHLIRISEDVASASTELAAVMGQAEQNSHQELAEIEQVASAVNELASTANNVSDNAQLADSTAREADHLAQSALSTFNESNVASEQMSLALQDAAVVVNKLKEQSEQINNVIEVISGISEQTNLLALNAAIEAARAGESGRGFAVVADEVRMLAARTQESTGEIQAIIEELQKQSGLANDSMHLSIEMLEKNNELAKQANDALVGITEAVTRINDANTQVATAAEEQSQVTQDINRNVVNMSELVSQNVSGISQSATASTELSELAEKQKAQLSFFTL
ncbi:methyl-accepting chemotaxis protein [Vibrio panuliri]|uniref:Chemotaxis protein n=1 Tax=Vibrio panuliri TaxID=1381081 RepID=A0ABX3FTW3_9VIBR|nr:methyl-accepting chemotaxis protein [Vibrio panuliri]KAB1458375.1 methyl-accepting chemotaxis protein [Vibrio panuliri]OLQ96373.1 chemotaxis protein [Vibrio panuliri]